MHVLMELHNVYADSHTRHDGAPEIANTENTKRQHEDQVSRQ